MNNLTTYTVKQLGRKLRDVLCNYDSCDKEMGITAISDYLTLIVIKSATDLANKNYALSPAYLEYMTGYTKKEIKDIAHFAAKMNTVCKESVIYIQEKESLDDYFIRLFNTLVLIRTKFPIFLWPGIALYLIIEKCAV